MIRSELRKTLPYSILPMVVSLQPSSEQQSCPMCNGNHTLRTIETRMSEMRLCLDCRVLFTVRK